MKNKFFNRLFLLSTALITMSVNVWSAVYTLLPADGAEQQGFTISCSSVESSDFRVYKGTNLSVTSTVGKMTNIELTFTKASEDGGGWASSYQPNAITWTSPTATSGKSGEQARVTKIVVTVADAGYTISYECNGATSGCPPQATGQTQLPNPLPAAPIKEGYDFDGWYTNEGLTSAATAGASISVATTLYAKWTAKNQYTVTFLNNGQPVTSIGTNGVKIYNEGDALGTLPTQGDMTPCDGTSITFMGWYAGDPIREKQKDPPTFVTSSTTVNDNMTLRAVWAREQ